MQGGGPEGHKFKNVTCGNATKHYSSLMPFLLGLEANENSKKSSWAQGRYTNDRRDSSFGSTLKVYLEIAPATWSNCCFIL